MDPAHKIIFAFVGFFPLLLAHETNQLQGSPYMDANCLTKKRLYRSEQPPHFEKDFDPSC